MRIAFLMVGVLLAVSYLGFLYTGNLLALLPATVTIPRVARVYKHIGMLIFKGIGYVFQIVFALIIAICIFFRYLLFGNPIF